MTDTNKKKIKAIVSDIDGTLLTSKHELSKRNESALRAAALEGVKVILATGKTRNSAIHLIEKLKLETYSIFLQGTIIYDPAGKVVIQHTLEPDLLRRAITYMEDRGFDLIMYSGMRLLTRAVTDGIVDATKRYHEPVPEAVGSLVNYVADMPVNKLIAIGQPSAITALRWQLRQILRGEAEVVQAGLATMLEIVPNGSGKGPALAELLKKLDIKADEVMALGDAENDIGMIRMAGIGVAMGNASADVKQAADHITGTNDEHGVAQAVEKFVLPIGEPKPEASSDKADKPATTDAPAEAAAPAATPAAAADAEKKP
ncbi:MAG: Cof-type HAD-IIB family hydrolase [Pleurocapsa minor GSE-CHR-MK-17-07R]|jgi:Cof subfamily protein (haloacid dehalogenase superfamily)|nr:Cof-type HAD-IIB family hydrolase [Pleurocapsa minor GSE-CHR-MK 17-07R]